MKKSFVVLAALSFIGLGACNNDEKASTTTTTATDTAAKVTAPDTSNGSTTTTTTTTTTVVTTKAPQYRTSLMTVKTNKPIKVMYDTVHMRYVDVTTNKEPTTYYYDPETHDTFDYRGYLLNNALIYNNGSYSVDTVRLMSNQYNVVVRDSIVARMGKTKTKTKGDKTKVKTD